MRHRSTLVAFPTTGPQDGATFDTVERLRTDAFPPILGQSPAHAHVGGQTASFADIGGRVNDRLPLFIAAVILLSFLLMTMVFRSILVPLKAALGIATTGRVITSAALIMISVFLGFVFGDDPATKMFGLGLATAIFVDATIVRMVLVPATMTLMGDANWWILAWLDRLLPTIDIEGGGRIADTCGDGEIRTHEGVLAP